MSIDIRAAIPRHPQHLGIAPNVTPPDEFTVSRLAVLREAAHTLAHKGDARDRIVGASFLAEPGAHLRLINEGLQVGHLLDRGQRAAEGERVNVYNGTNYGKMHEQARKGEETQVHGISHEIRLGQWAEATLMSKEFRLRDRRLYLIPHLWISHHDADQLDSEQAKNPDPRHTHELAGALQTLVLANRYRHEAFLSADDARLVTGITAGLILFHDEPMVQQRLLDATENDTGQKAYEDVGNGMRRYFSALELHQHFEEMKDNASMPGIDLFSLQDWQIADLTRYQKSLSTRHQYVTNDTPFGLSREFEDSFKLELRQISQGIRNPNEGRTLSVEEAEFHALVPEGLLANMTAEERTAFREDAMFLGDMLRVFDKIDMSAPADLAMTRKWGATVAGGRPLANGNEYERITNGLGELDEADTDLGRGLWETDSLRKQIKVRKGPYGERLHNRRSLDESVYFRRLIYGLHGANIQMHAEIYPLLMAGGRPNVPEEAENRARIDERIHRIFEGELVNVADELLRQERLERRQKTRRTQGAKEYAQGAQVYLQTKGRHKQAQRLEELERGVNATARNTLGNLDRKLNGQGLIPYSSEIIQAELALCARLSDEMRQEYERDYNENPPAFVINLPFPTYLTTITEKTPSRVRTIRPYEISDNQTMLVN